MESVSSNDLLRQALLLRPGAASPVDESDLVALRGEHTISVSTAGAQHGAQPAGLGAVDGGLMQFRNVEDYPRPGVPPQVLIVGIDRARISIAPRLRRRTFLPDVPTWPKVDQGVGWRYVGGTRTADSAGTVVVDKNYKVLGTDNPYVGGSSIFAIGGLTSPNYIIVELDPPPAITSPTSWRTRKHGRCPRLIVGLGLTA